MIDKNLQEAAHRGEQPSYDRNPFLRAIRTYCEGLESVAIGCLGEKCEYAEGDPDHRCEPGFSWTQCDSCGSTFGGDREEAHGIFRDGEGHIGTVQMSVCVDCVMYHANGDVPEEWQQSPQRLQG